MTDEASPRPRMGAAWVRIAKVGRVPIYIDLTLPLLLALLAYSGVGGREPLEIVLSLLALVLFVAWHEAGHAWMARRLGRNVGGIYLHLFPVTYLEAGEPREEAAIAFAGPAASLLLGGLLLGLHQGVHGFPGLPAPSGWLESPLLLAAGANLVMFLVNMLPVLPADGGRVFRALMTVRYGPDRARWIVGIFGLGVGLAGAAFVLAHALGPDATVSRWVALLPLYVAWVSARELASR